MLIRSPRTLHSSDELLLYFTKSMQFSVLENSLILPFTVANLGSILKMVCARILLPHPDSPTIPNVLLLFILNQIIRETAASVSNNDNLHISY